MKTLKVKTLLHLLLVLVIPLLTGAGCGDASGAPTIPPLDTFIISFEDFYNTNGLISLEAGSNQSN